MEKYIERDDLPLYLLEKINDLKKISQIGFLLILVINDGKLKINIDKKECLYEKKGIILINHKADVDYISSTNLKYKILCFNPKIVNTNIELDQIFMNTMANIDIYDKRDYYLFNKFKDKEFNYSFYSLDAHKLDKLIYLTDKIKNEISKKRDEFWPCRSRSYFLELLIFISTIEGDFLLESEKDWIYEIIDYINRNLGNKIGLEMIVKEFAVNRTTLNIKFKEQTGMTIKLYIITKRLSLAKAILKDTYLPIQEISLRVGYEEAKNFTRLFKKYTNCTPSQYRKKYKNI